MLESEYNPILFNEDLKKTALVFPNEDGVMIRPDSYYTTIRRFANKAGIHAFPHSFRHTFVYLMRGDLSLKDLQNILGHSESTTTLDIYGDMINDNISKNIEQMNNVFDSLNDSIETAKKEITKKKTKDKGKIINLFEKAK
jgi:site-specific recombinase XerD